MNIRRKVINCENENSTANALIKVKCLPVTHAAPRNESIQIAMSYHWRMYTVGTGNIKRAEGPIVPRNRLPALATGGIITTLLGKAANRSSREHRY